MAHQNGLNDKGYVNFLNQAITPALPYLKSSMSGLDFGCGPTPTLSLLLGKQGLHCINYDPIFFPVLPNNQFNYIFVTEVAEHFFNPAADFLRICNLLVEGGILTIMTEPWLSLDGFAEWHYAKDITHVSFYNTKTIEYISGQFNFEILNREAGRVTVLKKHYPLAGPAVMN